MFVKDEGHTAIQIIINEYLIMSLLRDLRLHLFPFAFPKHDNHLHDKYCLIPIFRVSDQL